LKKKWITMASTPLEAAIEQFIVATDTRCKELENWQDIEDRLLEADMTNVVKESLENEGFEVNVKQLKIIYTEKGSPMLQLDGLVEAYDGSKVVLATVEAKHHVTTSRIKEREERNASLAQLLLSLKAKSYDQIMSQTSVHAKFKESSVALLPFVDAEVRHYIGGCKFADSDQTHARRKGFYVVARQTMGGAYDVLNPTCASSS
jgi:DNA mismatch repair ATPase MutS